MLPLLAALTGALFGYRRAKLRDGNRFDRAQYAAVFAIAFGLIGLFANIVILRAL
ncbi:apolipoprotein acyltransferase [Albirhodobacter sp. R86504]|jgi:hypothetical protein|uniref:apolipoprotein acyltransferase n=1 Tax=Albirhodobacter sp. R86504 TaxID=3093848 RepID=UPI003671A5E9